MATNEEYQALIDSLSGECERLHKENEELRALLPCKGQTMTREDAIEKLELMRQKVDEETYRALILAIKALSQEPCTDAVSRAKAIENVVQIAKTFANSDKQKALCGRIIFMLEHMSEVSEMITEEYYKPCSLCHNADCVWMGGKDTHKLCEDFQALSQEPTDENLHREREQAYMQGYEDASKRFRQEPCEDVISRKRALEPYKYLNDDDVITVWMIKKNINELPSVTQKSGKWLETEYHRWRCSVCREKGMSEWDNIHNVRTNFCPNCGAKMEGEDV